MKHFIKNDQGSASSGERMLALQHATAPSRLLQRVRPPDPSVFSAVRFSSITCHHIPDGAKMERSRFVESTKQSNEFAGVTFIVARFIL